MNIMYTIRMSMKHEDNVKLNAKLTFSGATGRDNLI